MVNDLLEQKLISPTDLGLFKITHSVEETIREVVPILSQLPFLSVGEDENGHQDPHTPCGNRPSNNLTRTLIRSLRPTRSCRAPHCRRKPTIPTSREYHRIVLTPHKHDFGTIGS